MSNLDLWDKLGKTDPKHTKGFKRGGGFTGTAVKPIYTERKMTETFGPVGVGWGFSEPQFQLVPGDNKELLVFCWLTLWFQHDGKRSENIPGVGGDKVITHIKANEQYKRPERWENDDEAFKKAFTDAIGNAMKHIGMSADVHMGMFDDSKYVRETAAEFKEQQSDFPGDRPMGKVEFTDRITPALAFVAKAKTEMLAFETPGELRTWWESSADARTKAGLVKGTSEYADLFTAFVNHGKALAQPRDSHAA